MSKLKIKVPPRHPLNRLNTLRGFFAKFAEDVVVPITGNQNYADRLTVSIVWQKKNHFKCTLFKS